MTNLTVRVVGRPAPEGSHELGPNGQIRHSSKYLKNWRQAVNEAVRRSYLARGLGGADMPLIPKPIPVYLHVTHFMTDEQCRAAGTDEPVERPDVDKLVRATVDGIGDANAFTNDSQIVGLSTFKIRASPESPPGALIILTDHPINDTQRQEPQAGETVSSTGQYRITLECVRIDEDGIREWETLVEVTDSADALVTAWLPGVVRRLSDTISAEPDESPAISAVSPPEAPKRTRRTKAEMEAARAAEAAPEAPVAPAAAPSDPAPYNPFAPQ